MPEYFRSDENPLLGTDFERQKKGANAIGQTQKPILPEVPSFNNKTVHSCPEPYPVEKYVLIYEEKYGPNSPPRWEDEPRNSWEAHLKAFAISLMDMFSG